METINLLRWFNPRIQLASGTASLQAANLQHYSPGAQQASGQLGWLPATLPFSSSPPALRAVVLSCCPLLGKSNRHGDLVSQLLPVVKQRLPGKHWFLSTSYSD